MNAIRVMLAAKKWAEKLREIALRVDRNIPNHRDPEAFHLEKSEIVYAIKKIARTME